MAALLALITPLIALLASLLVIWTIRYLDVVEREPRKMIARALGTGCLTAIVASVWCQFPLAFWQGIGLGEQFVDFMSTVVDAPIWEELIKGAGLICLYRSKREKFDSLTDFVVYACAVAIGFELIENILYQWGQLEGKDQLGAWIDELNNRTLGSAGTHATFSAWLGLAAWIWIRGKSAHRFIFSAFCVLISMGLHAGNNLGAVLSQYGPPNETLPINRLGMLIGIVDNQLSLSLFLGLIIVCVLRDLHYLSDYAYELLIQQKEGDRLRASGCEESLRLLMNPINHLLAASQWSWNFFGGSDQTITDRSAFGRFARLAMAPARAESSSSSESIQFDRQAWIQDGLSLVAGIS
jgi:RsiW-degrading membrane proteinase PrsW (M82 family)